MEDLFDRLRNTAANSTRPPNDAAMKKRISLCGTHAPMTCSSVSFRCLSPEDQTSMRALIMWASINTNIPESAVMDKLAAAFRLATIADLDKADVDAAKVFLIDRLDSSPQDNAG